MTLVDSSYYCYQSGERKRRAQKFEISPEALYQLHENFKLCLEEEAYILAGLKLLQIKL